MVSLQGFRWLREGAIGGAGGAGRPKPWRTQRKMAIFMGRNWGNMVIPYGFMGIWGMKLVVLWLGMIFKNQLCWVTFWVS